MKKTLLTITILLATIMTTNAQEQKSYTRDGKTFVQNSVTTSKTDVPTTYLWRDSKGNEYPIILHTYVKGEKKGRTTCYVIKTSKKGNEYKHYLPDGEKIAKEILNDKGIAL